MGKPTALSCMRKQHIQQHMNSHDWKWAKGSLLPSLLLSVAPSIQVASAQSPFLYLAQRWLSLSPALRGRLLGRVSEGWSYRVERQLLMKCGGKVKCLRGVERTALLVKQTSSFQQWGLFISRLSIMADAQLLVVDRLSAWTCFLPDCACKGTSGLRLDVTCI